ncbi:MAG: hypothetical protein Sv326_1328 (plasmid) [Candidatus Fermentimicrarchaeum limneticum]|uniref:Uncharacterized protein n=1 Tax=Fermentimicrarchaeum limneticum TaxID=2795018 RepID=A0A7D6BR80_FERL1|nr:MAG: hypothetical protein Sv326_1328 [Candidatus Fermentimicrarchaeum limneticum]
MKPEKTESQKIGDELAEEMETYGLYDKIKMDIYEVFKNANDNLADINRKDLPVGRREIQFQYYGPRFVSNVMKLYIYLVDKIDYVKDTECKKLTDLQGYYDGKKDLGKMSFKDAKYYFLLERRMLEKLGIFRFEVEKLESKEKIMRDAFSSD